MLLESYLKKQLSRSYQNGQVILRGYEEVFRVANLKRLVFVTLSFFQEGEPRIAHLFAMEDQKLSTKQQVLQIAGSLAGKAHGDWLKTPYRAAQDSGLPIREVEIDQYGERGVVGKLDRTWYVLGDETLMKQEGIELGATSQALIQQMEQAGHQLLFLAQKQPKRLLAIMACKRDINTDAIQVVKELGQLGISVQLFTGEKPRIAQSVARELGIVQVNGDLSDADKRRMIENLQLELPECGFVSTNATHSLFPEEALVFIVRGRNQKKSVTIPTIESLVTEIKRARDIMNKVKHLFFWRSF